MRMVVMTKINCSRGPCKQTYSLAGVDQPGSLYLQQRNGGGTTKHLLAGTKQQLSNPWYLCLGPGHVRPGHTYGCINSGLGILAPDCPHCTLFPAHILIYFVRGVDVLAESISLLSVDESIASQQSCGIACITFNWFMLLGSATTVRALFAKTHRFKIIFHNQNFNMVQVTAWNVPKPMIGIILANILVLGVWTGLHPPRWVCTVTWIYELDRVAETTAYCSSEIMTLYLCLLVAINFVNIVLYL